MSSPPAAAPTAPPLLVTGATGFLGRALIARLRAERPELPLRALVRSATSAGLPPGVEVVAGDLEDPPSLAAAVSGAAAIVHAAAALASADRRRLERVNVEGTGALAAAARAAGVRRFLLVSTSAVYGPSPSGEPRPESAPLAPQGPYAASKAAAERAASEALGGGAELVVVRPTGLYGPRRELYAHRLRALGRLPFRVELPGGERVQPCHVADAVSALLRCLAAPAAGERRFNLAGRSALTIDELDARLAALAGIRLRRARLPVPLARALVALRLALAPREPEAARGLRERARGVELAWRVDASLAERRLGLVWTPLDEGLREMVEIFLAARGAGGRAGTKR